MKTESVTEKTAGISLRKRLLFAGLATILIGLTFFLLGEILIRLLTDPPLFIADPQFGSILRPNNKTRYVQRDVDQIVITNRFGFHDKDYLLEKPAGTRRILVLGDSYMEALQVSIEETFSQLLQNALNKEVHGFSIQTINAGKSGRGTLEEYLVLRLLGWKFEPDLIVQAFVMNDVSDDRNASQQIVLDEKGIPLQFKTEGISSIPLSWKRLLHQSRLCYFLLERFSILYRQWGKQSPAKNKDGNAMPNPATANDHFNILRQDYTDETYASWDITKRTLTLLSEECRQKGIPYILMIVPAESQFHTRVTPTTEYWKLEKPSEKPQEILNELGAQAGFYVVDLLPSFKTITDLPIHFEEGHWNPKGHRYAARAVADYILQHDLLSEKKPDDVK